MNKNIGTLKLSVLIVYTNKILEEFKNPIMLYLT